MKSHRATLTIRTPERMAFVNITSDVEGEVKSSGISEGLCLVNALHITASVSIAIRRLRYSSRTLAP